MSGFILQSPILDQDMMTSFIGPYFKKILDQDEFNARRIVLQGDPNQSFPFQTAVTLKLSSSDPMLVKPKCV